MAQFYQRFDPTKNSASQPVNIKKRTLPEQDIKDVPLAKRTKKSKLKGSNASDVPTSKHCKGAKSGGASNGVTKISENDLESSRAEPESEVKKKKSKKEKAEEKAEKSKEKSEEGNNDSREVQEAERLVNGKGGQKTSVSANEDGSETQTKAREKRQKEKKKKKTEDPTASHESAILDEHKAVRSKFQKATEKRAVTDSPQVEAEEKNSSEIFSHPVEAHGLEPLPQPALASQPVEKPTFSLLPPWLANPLQAQSAQSVRFNDLIPDAVILENLERQGLREAFPVQASVLPLLLPGPDRHRGDICISAATGSGKTLAYILPMIQELKQLTGTRLRGLIVVPTRELVSQARAVAEYCALGTKLQIATALGNRSMADERDILVAQYESYDPKAYEKQQDLSVDWSKVDLESLLNDHDDELRTTENFVAKYRSRVDILICTPGRLVDHMRSTKGFTLDHVRWLVIDEADRLLNESFQEWTEMVMPALESRNAFAQADKILENTWSEVVPRVIQKVILSATLTKDINKLNSLKLRNPKLVVTEQPTVATNGEVPSESNVEATAGLDSLNLPPSLVEYGVAVGDGSEKPLLLLELLRTKVNVFDLNGTHDKDSIADDEDDDTSSSSSDADSEASAESATPKSPIRGKWNCKPRQQPEHSASPSTALVFTRSTQAATRLSRLLSLLSAPISSMTGTLVKSSTKSSSRKVVSGFKQGKIRIIIATDRACRGLDLPGLGHVISYDVPTGLETYVHRVGRTARAGKVGTAWTMLAFHEARWFWKEIGKGLGKEGKIVRGGKVQKISLKLDKATEKETKVRYEKALKTLGDEVADGRGGKRKGEEE